MTQPRPTLVLVGYESEKTKGGGLAPVLTRRRRVNKNSVLITPLHRRASGAPTTDQLTKIASLAVSYDGKTRPFSLLYEDSTGTYYVDAHDALLGDPADDGVFAGTPTPYDTKNLVRDALFFGQCVRQALPHLQQRHGALVLEAQDWEGVTIALLPTNIPVTLTMHNTYDSGSITPALLERFEIDHTICPGRTPNATILQRALRRIVGPVRTVSEGFQRDILTEPLQVFILADHLQDELRRCGVVGIDNGPFKEPADGLNDLLVPPNPAGLRAWKQDRRNSALLALRTPANDAPIWGDPQSLNASLPWYIMAGRNDVRQKGFDVATDACRQYLADGGRGQFIFCPLITKEYLGQIEFLRKLATDHPENVVVFAGFCPDLAAFRQGADFGLMPSLYEPFGMANEYYLDGVPVIARATGGITQQVLPFTAGASYSQAVRERAIQTGSPTGILYREPDAISSDPAPWRLLNNAIEDPESWRASALYRAMTEELSLALTDAEHLTKTPHLYAELIVAGALHIQRAFSWHKNNAAYDRLIAHDLRAA